MKKFERPNILKSKTVMIIDDAYQTELARRLSRAFGRVLYFCEWRSNGYPKVEDWAVGQGIEGVESIENIFDYINITDLFVFTHILQSDLQVFLEKMGKLVYGPRRAEILEIDRSYTKDLLKKLELPVSNYTLINGTEDLHKYLQKNNNNWIKVDSKFRGLFETTHNIKYKLTEQWIDLIEEQLGAMGDQFEFLVDENIEGGLEIGGEYIFSGDFQNRNLFGIETKNKGYLGRIIERNKAPKMLNEITDKLSPIFKQFGYKGNYSDEVRVTPDGKGYLIDPTCRFPVPPGYLMQYMYKNFDEILWGTSLGQVIEPIYDYEYGCELLIYSRINEKNFLPVFIPNEIRDNVFLSHMMVKNNLEYITPNGFIGSVCSSASTLEGAIKQVEDIAGQIEGLDLEYDVHSLKRAMDEIELLDEFNINFFKNDK